MNIKWVKHTPESNSCFDAKMLMNAFGVNRNGCFQNKTTQIRRWSRRKKLQKSTQKFYEFIFRRTDSMVTREKVNGQETKSH